MPEDFSGFWIDEPDRKAVLLRADFDVSAERDFLSRIKLDLAVMGTSVVHGVEDDGDIVTVRRKELQITGDRGVFGKKR